MNRHSEFDTLIHSTLEAGKSIDVVANLDPRTHNNSLLSEALGSVTALADHRLQLRCIIHWPDDHYTRTQVRAKAFEAEISAIGWQVRSLSTPASMDIMIVDGRVANRWRRMSTGSSYLLVTDMKTVSFLQTHFEELWETSTIGNNNELIYEDIIKPSLPEYKKKIIGVSQKTWDRIISTLASNPNDLFTLEPHRFEELIAELLIRDGMKVQLTQKSRDGGRDILAIHQGVAGQHLYLVECKRYASSNPIGVGMVRSLYGVIEQERATAGLFVTTSRFTSSALDFVKPIHYRMSLKEYSDLVSWLRGHIRLVRN